MSKITRKDCAGYSTGSKQCMSVEPEFVDCETCPFYRTHAQQADSQAKAFSRLNELSDYDQLMIGEKYYNGKMPWRNEAGGADQ